LRCLPPSSLLGVLPRFLGIITLWLCPVICLSLLYFYLVSDLSPATGELECSFLAYSLERNNNLVDWAELPNVLGRPFERPALLGVSDGVTLA